MDALTRFTASFLILLATLYFNVASAQLSVTLVEKQGGTIAKRLQQVMAELEPGTDIDIASPEQAKNSKNYLVLLGQPDPAAVYSNARGVVSAFISEARSQQVKANAYVFVDPPLSRQIRLADSLISGIKPLGLIVSTQQNKAELAQTLDASLFEKLNLVSLEQEGGLNQALFKALKNSRALVGVYDTDIYNPTNIKNILITSYRQNKVLIGPSRAYLKAGSYATTFSGLNDIARRILELIKDNQSSGRWSAQGHNPYFSILINKQVARSLNLSLPDVEAVQKMLEEAEK